MRFIAMESINFLELITNFFRAVLFLVVAAVLISFVLFCFCNL